MYFHGSKGKQILDLRNDLVLTFDKQLVTAKDKKVAPDGVRNGNYILMQETSRLKAMVRVLWFIWSKNLLKIRVRTMADGKEATTSWAPENEDAKDSGAKP